MLPERKALPWVMNGFAFRSAKIEYTAKVLNVALKKGKSHVTLRALRSKYSKLSGVLRPILCMYRTFRQGLASAPFGHSQIFSVKLIADELQEYPYDIKDFPKGLSLSK